MRKRNGERPKMGKISPHTVRVVMEVGNLTEVLPRNFGLRAFVEKVLEGLVFSQEVERFGTATGFGVDTGEGVKIRTVKEEWLRVDEDAVKGCYLRPLGKDKGQLCIMVRASFISYPKL